MTCYMRQMSWLFEALDLPYDKEHRKLVDRGIRDVLGLADEQHCPEVWSAIKALSEDERAELPARLQGRLG